MFTILQSADTPIVGIASMPLPHAQRVAIAALDSNGFLHLFSTPRSADVVVWDKQTDGPAAEVAGAAQQGMSVPALAASRGSEASQEQERAADNAGSGEILYSGTKCLSVFACCPWKFKQASTHAELQESCTELPDCRGSCKLIGCMATLQLQHCCHRLPTLKLHTGLHANLQA